MSEGAQYLDRKLINWPEYNRALVNRGSLTFWFGEDIQALVIVSATACAWVTPRILHRRFIAAGRRFHTRSAAWRGRNDDQADIQLMWFHRKAGRAAGSVANFC